jgi:hypothetical protein
VSDLFHLPTPKGYFQGFVLPRTGGTWMQWSKPRGVSTVGFFVLGAGGNGGNGHIGAIASAGGGGAGGSGSQSYVVLSARFLPETLYIYMATNPAVLVAQQDTAMNRIITANSGGNGGNSSSATGGTAGAAGAVATIANMPLAGFGMYTLIAGAAGTTGADAGVSGFTPATGTTGLRVWSGGSGSGGPNALLDEGRFSNATGGPPNAIGAITGNGISESGSNAIWTQPYRFTNIQPSVGGAGGYGGTGTGGAGHGGAGTFGCGGGGGGGALTGSAAGAGVGGLGGPALVLIWAR